MDLMSLMKNRYTVRKFSDKKVEKEKIEKLLEAGNVAPTAKNNQPQRIYILQSEEAIKKIESLCPCIYGAKTVFMFTYNKDEQWQSPDDATVHSGVEDVSIVATHMMLMAEELGLSTCWINRFNNRIVEKEFNLPSNEFLVLLMSVGYREDDCKPAPAHSNKKNISDIVKYL